MVWIGTSVAAQPLFTTLNPACRARLRFNGDLTSRATIAFIVGRFAHAGMAAPARFRETFRVARNASPARPAHGCPRFRQAVTRVMAGNRPSVAVLRL